MAEDDNGIDPVAADGEPDQAAIDAKADELAKRRAATNGGGGSLADRGEQAAMDTGDPPAEPEDDGALFVWEQGRKVSLGTLIARGTPVEHHFVFGGRRSKGSGGLMGFDAKPMMIVRGKPGPVKIVPTFDDDEKVLKVAIENHVEAVIVKPADSEDGLAMISHILDDMGYRRTAAA